MFNFSIGSPKKHKQDRILEIIKMHCCTHDCLKCLSYKDISEANNKFRSLSSIIEERNYILNFLHDNASSSHGIGSAVSPTACKFQVKGKPVCKQAWVLINDINPKRFNRIWHDFANGAQQYKHGNSGSKRHSTKS
jgi:hypothetical protein